MKFLRAVDLFCGIGGFALGMQKAGIKIVRSMDYDPAVIAVHKANIKNIRHRSELWMRVPPLVKEPEPGAADSGFERDQIHKSRRISHRADLTAVIDIAPEIAQDAPDVIFGGPPCQAFSRAGKGEGDNDARSLLTEAYAIIVAAARPKYFVMENVKGLRKSQTYKRAVAIFRRAGYGLSETVVNASRFGTPQGRERLILAGCLDESDGWFHAYLNQYKSAEPLTVADVLGADFGTALSDFVLDSDCTSTISAEAALEYKGYKLRDRDLKRLNDADVTPDTRFYFCTPGGKESAAIQRIDRPAPTLIRTSMHLLPGTYRPVAGDPVDLGKLWQPSFEQYARLAGYPDGWNWGKLRSQQDGKTPEEMILGARQRQLMLANSVPPPLAYAIGRALVDHFEQRVPIAPVAAEAIEDSAWQISDRDLKRYRKWLRVGKGLTGRAVSQQVSDLRGAKSLVAGRKLDTAKDEIEVFDRLPATVEALMTPERKSQLRRALLNMAEFELYLSALPGAPGFTDTDRAYGRGGLDFLLSPEHFSESDTPTEEERARTSASLARISESIQRQEAERSQAEPLVPAE